MVTTYPLSNRSLIVGIDPGFTGALAFAAPHAFKTNGMELVSIHDMPCRKYETLAVSVSGKTHSRQTVDGSELCRILSPLAASLRCAIVERVHSAPEQGVASTFRFGEGYGVVQGVLAALGIKVVFVEPSVWKIKMGLRGMDKSGSIEKAIEIFGGDSREKYFSFKKHHGRAEAALLSVYGHKMMSSV